MPPPPDPSYNTVPERIAEFRSKHPDGRLRPLNPAEPYHTVSLPTVNDDGQPVTVTFIVYTAAAYRNDEDKLPGVGIAWEPFPGQTPYTRDSELMNAETAAWGRAIVAALQADANKGIASQEEVRARQRGASPESMRDAMWWLVEATKLGLDLDLDVLLEYAAKSDAHAAKLVRDLGARMQEHREQEADQGEPGQSGTVATADTEVSA